MNRILLTFLGLGLAAACDEQGAALGSQHQEAHHEPNERKNEVHLSAEAIELSGLRVQPVQRRALSGGAIPAEVQLDPSSTAHVAPLVPGRITRVDAGLGDRVRKGQRLGVIASSDVSTARARLERARARLSAAESTLQRQQQLSTEGIGAQRSLIEAEAEVGELRAEVEGLRKQLSVLGSGSDGEIVLTSPIEGVVVAVHGTLGETAKPEEPAFVVTDPTKVWVRGNVPELWLDRVRSGMKVIVRLHAFPDLAMSGAITYMAPTLDERTRSLPVRITLENPDARLRSGLFGSIELVPGDGVDPRVLAVPMDAVATLDGQTVVFVPGSGPGEFRAKPIALGQRAGGFVTVRSGLTEGTLIVVSGVFTLKSASRREQLSSHDH